jgi:uncharacterized protein YbjT (DUF2867 family)
VRREDERAKALRRLGAEIMQGDLTDLTAMHRAIDGCARVYFGMSVSADYLTATVNTAAVARHHGVVGPPGRHHAAHDLSRRVFSTGERTRAGS